MEPVASKTPIMSERRVGVIGACLTMLGPFSMSVYTPAMPEIVEAFGTTASSVKLSLSLFFAGFALAQLVCGPLSDGLGRRPVTVAFAIIYTVASLAALFAPNIEWLIVSRFLQGIGAAVGVAVSRAIVRDLFTHEQSARIMNLIGTMLAVGPALAPTIGGLTMEAFGWQAIFVVMALAGVGIVVMAIFVLRETVTFDPSRIRPGKLLRGYRAMLASRWFMSAALTNGFATGSLYALATMLPFVLMDRAGLSPSQFGLAMLLQSCSFFAGTLALRGLMRRFSAGALVPVGLFFVGSGSLLLALLTRTGEPSVLTIMMPVACIAFGIAFIGSAMITAALALYGANAGAAAAMSGFLQMTLGMAGGLIAAWLGDPVLAIGTVIPFMGAMAILSWLTWRGLAGQQL